MKYDFPFFEVVVEEPIAILYLNKPDKRNAMEWSCWRDLPLVIDAINQDDRIRAFVIAGRGKSFTTGLDLDEFFTEFKDILHGDIGDKREKLYQLILTMQEGMNRIENSPKPSIAAVHKHCIGGGLDLIAACDIRYASKDANISLREAKVAIVADMGSLNRLPSIIGEGNTRELALTGKDISGEEALNMGLVTKLFETPEELLEGAKATALEIANNPAIVIRGVKNVMNYCRDKSIQAGLQYVASYNAGMLDTKDLRVAYESFQNRKRPIYNQS
ncbi:MAG: crotonase/enoyl-CoA hydratase family protein [Leptospira sp.]|nr:crotonase/enoyl-CoA hydratase family protein [Leptospira sp.]